MRLIFIRHPKTKANEEKLVYGRTDALYSEAGEGSIPEIVGALDEIEIDELIASPLTRTKILAEKIGEAHGIPKEEILLDDRILEMNFGIFENMKICEIQEKYPAEHGEFMANYNQYRVPEGESYELLYERVREFLEEIYDRYEVKAKSKEDLNPWEALSGQIKPEKLKKHREKTVVVVAHSMVIHAALAFLLKIDLNEIWHIKIEPGSLVDLDYRCEFAMLQELKGPFNVRLAK